MTTHTKPDGTVLSVGMEVANAWWPNELCGTITTIYAWHGLPFIAVDGLMGYSPEYVIPYIATPALTQEELSWLGSEL